MIDLIRERFRRMEYEYSLHALDQSIQRRVSTTEVEESIEAGEVIETYPSDSTVPVAWSSDAPRPAARCIFNVRSQLEIPSK